MTGEERAKKWAIIKEYMSPRLFPKTTIRGKSPRHQFNCDVVNMGQLEQLLDSGEIDDEQAKYLLELKKKERFWPEIGWIKKGGKVSKSKKTQVNSLTDEDFESIAECLEEFAKSDPTFPVMNAILKMVAHARELRGIVVEMATGIEDEQLSKDVVEILGDWE